MSAMTKKYASEVRERLQMIENQVDQGGFDDAVRVMEETFVRGGVLHAFGTGHSEAFAMEMAGRAGGFIPTHQMALHDLFLLGGRSDIHMFGSPDLERDSTLTESLYSLYDIRPEDALIIASNSGANGSTVELALRARAMGLPVIAVTSMEHTRAVKPKHPSGKKLFEVADVVIDNLAPYGDTTVPLDDQIKVGAVSSITAAFIAQFLTILTAEKLKEHGEEPLLYISANTPEGDGHNTALQDRFGSRILPYHYQNPSVRLKGQ